MAKNAREQTNFAREQTNFSREQTDFAREQTNFAREQTTFARLLTPTFPLTDGCRLHAQLLVDRRTAGAREEHLVHLLEGGAR